MLSGINLICFRFVRIFSFPVFYKLLCINWCRWWMSDPMIVLEVIFQEELLCRHAKISFFITFPWNNPFHFSQWIWNFQSCNWSYESFILPFMAFSVTFLMDVVGNAFFSYIIIIVHILKEVGIYFWSIQALV